MHWVYCVVNTMNQYFAIDISADTELNQRLASQFNVPPPFGLEDFTYKNSKLLEVISHYLSEISFNGITVRYKAIYSQWRNYYREAGPKYKIQSFPSSLHWSFNWVETGITLSTSQSERVHCVLIYLFCVQGPVKFDADGIRTINNLIVYQYRYKTGIKITLEVIM